MPKVMSWVSRRRGAVWGAVVLVFAMVGTAGATAGAMLHLNVTNTATTTTTLKSAVNGSVLQITNTNTVGGTSARGLAITVPAGRAPLRVNATAGKATNLNADKLDGLDSTRFARGTGVTVLSNRLVVPQGQTGVELLVLGSGLGVLRADCILESDSNPAYVYWYNWEAAGLDVWTNSASTDGRLRHASVAPFGSAFVAFWLDSSQFGDTLLLGTGTGNTAHVVVAAFRASAQSDCVVQATATIWVAP